MKFEIAKHAFGLIARNIGMAVRIVVLPWILIRMLNYVLLFLLFITGLGQAETIPGSGVFLVWNLFHFVVVFAGTVWIMIGWNRFILLDDLTDTNWPQWSWALVKAYLIRFFFIVTALIVPLLITILVSTVLNEARGEHLGANAHTLLMRILSEVVTCMLFFYCLFRISLGLPSAALGKRMYIRESFSKTKSYGGDIWGRVS